MSNLIRYFLIPILLMTTTAFAVNDALVAVVGDAVITESKLKQNMRIYRKMLDPNVLKKMDDAVFKSQVLQAMIDIQLQKNIASKAGISLTKEEKNSVRQSMAKQSGKSLSDFKEEIRRSGLNAEQYLTYFEEQALLQKTHQVILGPQIKVSSSDIEALKKDVEARQTEYFVEDIVFEKINTPEALSNSQIQAAKLSASWPTSAYSKWNVPQGSRMIQFRWKKLVELPEVFQPYVAKLAESQCPEPISTESGVHVLKLIRKRYAEGGMPTDTQLKEYTFNTKMQKELVSWIHDLKAQTYIYIATD
ncbi:MAG: SurA N-terminal domain-containing protein [Pseudomonadota bacterium]|nr:SurA N-terminal domain-containing protein [Pseudomonadota bacterium]